MAAWKRPTTLLGHLAEALPAVLIVLAMFVWMFLPDPEVGASAALASEVDP